MQLPEKQFASGFTLIELLIALTLGVLILGAVGSVYVGSKRTYSQRDTLSLIQENGRIAIQLLEYGISPAGYPAINDINPFNEDETADGPAPTRENPNPSDKIAIQYSPDTVSDNSGYIHDCLGGKRDSFEMIENQFSVADGKLRCGSEARPFDADEAPTTSNPQPIAEGIRKMEIEYGILNTNIEYHTATQINEDDATSDALRWEEVISVKIDLEIETPKDVDPFDESLRTFSTIIPLRNRIPLPGSVDASS